jgi:hypothetical protein
MAQRAEKTLQAVNEPAGDGCKLFEQQKATVQIKTLRLRSATGKNNPGSE